MAMEIVPKGFYRAVAVPQVVDGVEFSAQFGDTKDGLPQVVVLFAIIDGPWSGRRLYWFGFFTEKSAKRTIESLRFCGFKGDDLSALLSQKINQEVSITVGHNDWEGKVTARVDWVNAAGGGGAIKLERPMAKDQLRLFAAKMKMHIKGVAEVAGQAAEVPAPGSQPASAPAEPAGDQEGAPWGGEPQGQRSGPRPDDDIPF